MVRILSAIAIAMVLSGVWVGKAEATGTCEITELCDPVDKVGSSLRSAEVVEGIGLVLLAFVLFGIGFGHFGAGFGSMVGLLIGLGFWFQAEAIAEAIGWSAIGF